MSWGGLSNNSYVVSKDTTKGIVATQRIDYDTPDPEQPIQFHVHEDVSFFGTTTRTTTEYVGLTQAEAIAMVNASGAQSSTYEWKEKQAGVTGFYARAYIETASKTTSARRVDASGQFHVTVVETTTTVS